MPTYGQAASSGNSQIQTRLNVSYSDNDPVNGNSNVTVKIQYRRTSTASNTYYANAPYTITIGSAAQGTLGTPTYSGTATFDVRGFTANTWYDFASYTVAVHGGQAITISGTISLSGTSAVKCSSSGTIPQLTITFNGNGNTGGSMSSYTITSGISKKIPYNAFTKTGYSFAGWRIQDVTENTWRGYNNSEQATLDYYPASEITSYYIYGDYTSTSGRQNNHTLCLHAQWTINSYTLTVNPNGGTWNNSTSSQTFTQNYNTTKTIANPTRSGYRFAGWTKSGSGTISGTTFTYGAGACTLTAKWVAVYYLDLNVYVNGNLANSTTAVTADVYINGNLAKSGVSDYYIQHDTGTTYEIKNIKINSNYVQYKTENLSGTLTTKTTASIYVGQKYTITYKANGGAESDVTQTINYGTSWTTKGLNTFTKTGYFIHSWNTAADGSGTKYSVNAAQTDKQLANLTLCTQWQAKTYTHIYKANGGVGDDLSVTVTYDASFTTKGEIFTREGYTLVGWYVGNDGSDTVWGVNATGTYKTDDSLILYAKWAKNYNAAVYMSGNWKVGQLFQYKGGTWKRLEVCEYVNGVWEQTKRHE